MKKKYVRKYSPFLPEYETKDKIRLLNNLRKNDEIKAWRFMEIIAILAIIVFLLMVLMGIQF